MEVEQPPIPTDGNNVAFVPELDQYRFWCSVCNRWGKHLAANCPKPQPTDASATKPVAKNNPFAGVAHHGFRTSIVDNDEDGQVFEPEPGNYNA